jgi:hypothetical protein
VVMVVMAAVEIFPATGGVGEVIEAERGGMRWLDGERGEGN